MFVSNLVFLTRPDIGENSDGSIFNFQISGQFFIKRNCHKARTSDDIDMKFGATTKLDKKNKSDVISSF